MRYRPLGRTGQFVSEICLGTMTFHGGSSFWRNIGTLDQQNATGLVARALEAGVNFIDTADVYSEGGAELMLGQALADLKVAREDVIVATKVRGRTGAGPNAVGLSRGHIMDQIAGSLKRLKLDYVDLYQIHGFDAQTPLEETLRALDDCVSRGLVRTIGCSNVAAWQIMKAQGISERRGFARFETVQAYYTIAGRELEREILPVVEDQGMGVMVWSPLAGGFLSGKFTREGDMQLVGQRIVDRLDVGVGEQFLIGAVGARDAEPLGRRPRPRAIARGDGLDAAHRALLHRRDHFLGGDLGDAEHAPSDGIAHALSSGTRPAA